MDEREGLATLRREFFVDGVAPKEDEKKTRRRCAMKGCSGRVRQATDKEIPELLKAFAGQKLRCEKCGTVQNFLDAAAYAESLGE